MNPAQQASFRPRRVAYALRATMFAVAGLMLWLLSQDAAGLRLVPVAVTAVITLVLVWQALDPRPAVLFDDRTVKVFGAFRTAPGRSRTYLWSEIAEVSDLAEVRSQINEGFRRSRLPLIPGGWTRFLRTGSGSTASMRARDGRVFRIWSAGDDAALREVCTKMRRLQQAASH